MTRVDDSPVTREVRVQEGNRWVSYVARFTGEGIYMREKGKRTEYGPVSYGAVLSKGVWSKAHDNMMASEAAKSNGNTRRKRVSRSLI
jgi:hypothetical protein